MLVYMIQLQNQPSKDVKINKGWVIFNYKSSISLWELYFGFIHEISIKDFIDTLILR